MEWRRRKLRQRERLFEFDGSDEEEAGPSCAPAPAGTPLARPPEQQLAPAAPAAVGPSQQSAQRQQHIPQQQQQHEPPPAQQLTNERAAGEEKKRKRKRRKAQQDGEAAAGQAAAADGESPALRAAQHEPVAQQQPLPLPQQTANEEAAGEKKKRKRKRRKERRAGEAAAGHAEAAVGESPAQRAAQPEPLAQQGAPQWVEEEEGEQPQWEEEAGWDFGFEPAPSPVETSRLSGEAGPAAAAESAEPGSGGPEAAAAGGAGSEGPGPAAAEEAGSEGMASAGAEEPGSGGGQAAEQGEEGPAPSPNPQLRLRLVLRRYGDGGGGGGAGAAEPEAGPKRRRRKAKGALDAGKPKSKAKGKGVSEEERRLRAEEMQLRREVRPVLACPGAAREESGAADHGVPCDLGPCTGMRPGRSYLGMRILKQCVQFCGDPFLLDEQMPGLGHRPSNCSKILPSACPASQWWQPQSAHSCLLSSRAASLGLQDAAEARELEEEVAAVMEQAAAADGVRALRALAGGWPAGEAELEQQDGPGSEGTAAAAAAAGGEQEGGKRKRKKRKVG